MAARPGLVAFLTWTLFGANALIIKKLFFTWRTQKRNFPISHFLFCFFLLASHFCPFLVHFSFLSRNSHFQQCAGRGRGSSLRRRTRWGIHSLNLPLPGNCIFCRLEAHTSTYVSPSPSSPALSSSSPSSPASSWLELLLITLVYSLLLLLLLVLSTEWAKHLWLRDSTKIGVQTFMEMLRGAPCVLQAGARRTAAQFPITCSGFVSAWLALQTQVSTPACPRPNGVLSPCRKHCLLTRVGDGVRWDLAKH